MPAHAAVVHRPAFASPLTAFPLTLASVHTRKLALRPDAAMIGPRVHAASSSFRVTPHYMSLSLPPSCSPTIFCCAFLYQSINYTTFPLSRLPFSLSHYSVSSLRSATTFCIFASPMCNTFSPITGTQKQSVDLSTDSAFTCTCHD